MSGVPYWHVDAFASRPFTGNQAAVVELDQWLDDLTLQAIAEENNFAETAFVIRSSSSEADWDLRWFAPRGEVRLCGHATLASGHALLTRDGGDAVRFQTREAGVLVVQRGAQGGYEMALPAVVTAAFAWPELGPLMGCEPQAIARNHLGYTVLHYGDEAEVRGLQPDFAGLWALGNEQFICTAKGTDTDVVSRVFVPRIGIDEDSVTGSAHAVLTPYWAPLLGVESFTAYQASERGGYLTCRLVANGEPAEDNPPTAWIGGDCVTVAEGRYFTG